jgi:hypothetical protein
LSAAPTAALQQQEEATMDPAPTDHEEPLRSIEDAYARALACVGNPAASPLDAVAWISAHLAAFAHAVHPAAVHALADETAVSTLRDGALLLERVARRLEQLGSGDWLAGGMSSATLTGSFTRLVADQADREHVLLRRLADRLTVDEQRQLAAAYRHSLEHAPTRPHPHMPHGAALGALVYHVNAVRDRVMDTLDSRPTPAPRPARRQTKPGLWVDYLAGITEGTQRASAKERRR